MHTCVFVCKKRKLAGYTRYLEDESCESGKRRRRKRREKRMGEGRVLKRAGETRVIKKRGEEERSGGRRWASLQGCSSGVGSPWTTD